MRDIGKGLVLLLIAGLFVFFAVPAFAQEDTETTEDISGDELTAEDAASDFETEMELKAQEQKIQAAAEFERAQKALDARSFLEAIAALSMARELDPENETYTEQLKVVRTQYIKELLDDKDYDLAISEADRFLEEFGEDTTVRNFRNAAVEMREIGDVEESEEDIVPVVIQDTRTPQELYQDAKTSFYQKDYREAQRLLERAHELDPFNININLFLNLVNDQIYRYARSNRRVVMNEMLYDIEKTWLKRVRKPTEITLDILPPRERPIPPSRQRILEKLETIIPQVEFNDAQLKEVIDYLSKRVGVSIVIDESVFRAGPRMPTTGPFGPGTTPPFTPGFDPRLGPGSSMPGPGSSMPGGTGSMPTTDPFLTTDDPFGTQPDNGFGDPFPTDPFTTPGTTIQPVDLGGITISLSDIPLKEVLKYVLRMKDLKYIVEDYAIVILRRGDVLPEQLETEIFRLTTSGTGAGTGMFGASRPGLDTGGTGGFTSGGFTGTGGFGTGTGTGTGFGQPGAGFGPQGMADTGSENIRDFLLRSGVEWPGGSNIIYHQTTATLIVTNTPTNLTLIRELVRIYDQPPFQVEVEARFVEVQLTREFENQFQIGMDSAITWYRKQDLAAGRPLTSIERVTTNFDPRGIRRTSSQVFGEGGPSGNILQIQGILTNPEFSVIWYALDRNKFAELLNAPRVTTISGQQAQIQVVTEIRYPTEFEVESLQDIFIGTGTGGQQQDVDFTGLVPFFITPQSFETRNIGTLLTVTPTVSADGKVITLVLFPEVSELLDWIVYGRLVSLQDGQITAADSGTGSTFSGTSAPQPVFGSRNVTTTVYVNDGETIVLGGLITERSGRYKDKVPIFGSLPIVGRLFRTELEDSEKRNLIIFVTARLVTSRGTELKEEQKFRDILQARVERAQEAVGTDFD